MNITNHKKFNLYAITIISLLFILYFVYYTFPAIQGMNQANDLLHQKELELETKKLRAENIFKFGPQDEFALDATRHQIPERPYIEQIIRELKSLEHFSGLSFSNYNVSSKTTNQTNSEKSIESKAVIPLHMTTTFRGKKSQLLSLLKELQYTQRIFHVENLNVTSDVRVPVALTDGNEMVDGVISFNTYYVPNLQKYFKDPREIDTF